MNKIVSTENVYEQWKAWNTNKELTSQKRNVSKIESLQSFVRELAQGDSELSERVEDVTRDFFTKHSMPSVERLLNEYSNYIPELHESLAPLADVVSNTWKFS